MPVKSDLYLRFRSISSLLLGIVKKTCSALAFCVGSAFIFRELCGCFTDSLLFVLLEFHLNKSQFIAIHFSYDIGLEIIGRIGDFYELLV